MAIMAVRAIIHGKIFGSFAQPKAKGPINPPIPIFAFFAPLKEPITMRAMAMNKRTVPMITRFSAIIRDEIRKD